MSQRVIDEWNKPELEYVEPTQVTRSFGYDVFAAGATPKTMEHLEKTVACVMQVDGEVAEQRLEYTNRQAASAAIKQVGKDIGATMVGITHVDPYHVYKGCDVPHRYAVILAAPMEYDEMKHGATDKHVQEVLRTYAEVGELATELAKFIRARGYPARAHSLRFEQINMLPHAYAAGLGELGKHGSLINLELGCSFRVSAVTTDLPLVEDAPQLEGIDEICVNCAMCTKYCPGDAISTEKQEVRGITKWVVDTQACAPYWGSYHSCGICLQVCPFNAKGFDGRYKESFVQHLKSIDLPKWRAELQDGLQEPWTKVEKPAEQEPGWRNRVRGKGESAFLMQGIPEEGLPDEIYTVRSAMGSMP